MILPHWFSLLAHTDVSVIWRLSSNRSEEEDSNGVVVTEENKKARREAHTSVAVARIQKQRDTHASLRHIRKLDHRKRRKTDGRRTASLLKTMVFKQCDYPT
jgi:uncharacterized membrane protein YcjF (UPF0283 family)